MGKIILAPKQMVIRGSGALLSIVGDVIIGLSKLLP